MLIVMASLVTALSELEIVHSLLEEGLELVVDGCGHR